MKDTKYDILRTQSGDYKTTLHKKFLSRKPYEPVNPNNILSFMPGTVEEIRVKVGQKVKKGDSLMIFRAMKMSNNILSPSDGKVKSINVEKGVNLPKDTIMIEIE